MGKGHLSTENVSFSCSLKGKGTLIYDKGNKHVYSASNELARSTHLQTSVSSLKSNSSSYLLMLLVQGLLSQKRRDTYHAP